MSPPTEQLIRDYLNRLSVAARGWLTPEERRTLIERTRQLIEQKADFAGRPTTLEVGRVLARLGDPAALVEQELRRLGDLTGEPEHHVTDGGFLARVLRREPAWVRGAHWSPPAELGIDDDEDAEFDDAASAEAEPLDQGPEWLAQNGHDAAMIGEVADGTVLDGAVLDGAVLDGAVLEGTVLDAEIAAPIRPQWPDIVAREDSPRNGRRPRGRSVRPARSETGSWVTLNGAAIPTGASGNGGLFGPGDPPGTGTADRNTDGIDSAWQLETPVTSAVGSAMRRLLRRLYEWSRTRPVETVALVLLGVGGLIFPPVFLGGAAAALLSREWDYRDKWLGLGLPIVLTVIGLAVGIAMGGRSHGLHEGWIWLNIISRMTAALGAGYLAWRTTHGRQTPAVPPWNKPHKVH